MGINDLKKEKVAIKMIDLNRIKKSKSLRLKLQKEIQTIKSLDHPGVIKLYDTVQTSQYFCMVQEYAAGGDLFELISNNTKVLRMQIK